MPNEITDAAARSAKASKTLDTMRARIVKADEARTDAAHGPRPRPRPRTAKRPRRGMPWRPMPPNKPASVATAQSWPTARAAGGRAREPRPGLSVFSSRPARRPRAVGSVTVRAGLDRAGRYLPVVPQRAGCVTRRAVAERRTAQPLTRPTREGYPGRFWLMGEALSTIVRRIQSSQHFQWRLPPFSAVRRDSPF